jgi:hypothetical protein
MIPLVWIVILIEAIIIKKRIGHSYIKAFRTVTLANLFSTFIGIPITWFVSIIFTQLILESTSPYKTQFPEIFRKAERVIELMIDSGGFLRPPAHVALFATIFLLIPYYYMSVFSEHIVIKGFYKDVEPIKVKRAVIFMNRITYILLGSLMLIIFLLGEYYFKWE